jgi:hypothetical protein
MIGKNPYEGDVYIDPRNLAQVDALLFGRVTYELMDAG